MRVVVATALGLLMGAAALGAAALIGAGVVELIGFSDPDPGLAEFVLVGVLSSMVVSIGVVFAYIGGDRLIEVMCDE